MLTLFRSIIFVLALPFLTVAPAEDFSHAAKAVSLYAKLSVVESSSATWPAKPALPHTKRATAELQDGPEGEDAPLANLVRGYDGDDQIQSALAFTRIAFRFRSVDSDFHGIAAAPSHFACAGLPTGPPSA